MITILVGLSLFLGSLAPVFIVPVFAWLVRELSTEEE